MNRETLIVELDRLLDAGEPLLTMFPYQHPAEWWLRLPGTVSDEMCGYAGDVAWRTWNRKKYYGFRQRKTTDELAVWVKQCEFGLLGWRAIGVLK